MQSLSSETLGDPRICIAVLDGSVDQSHPCFEGANLTQLQTLVSGFAKSGSVAQYGTHVASIIFGQPSSSVPGIAPRCRGLIVPVFADGQAGSLVPCSQLDLARAITQAVEQGANIINISGGQLTQSGEPDPFLTNAIQLCRENNVLIVAATGNDGCACLHLPAANASVLAVGAMDVQSQPMGFSNWGEAYQTNGILALGENILGAVPGGGTKTMSGTSFAVPIVSGIVVLLLSHKAANPIQKRFVRRFFKVPCPVNNRVQTVNAF
ncbi:S8 family serine peptidase [Gloeocapsa sp. BRSZ]